MSWPTPTELFVSQAALLQYKGDPMELVRHILRVRYRHDEFHYYAGREPHEASRVLPKISTKP